MKCPPLIIYDRVTGQTLYTHVQDSPTLKIGLTRIKQISNMSSSGVNSVIAAIVKGGFNTDENLQDNMLISKLTRAYNKGKQRQDPFNYKKGIVTD